MLCGSSRIYLFGCLRVRMFKKRRRAAFKESLEARLQRFWNYGLKIRLCQPIPKFPAAGEHSLVQEP